MNIVLAALISIAFCGAMLLCLEAGYRIARNYGGELSQEGLGLFQGATSRFSVFFWGLPLLAPWRGSKRAAN